MMKISDYAIELLIILMLVFTPLAFGTVQVWSITVFELTVVAAALVWIWKKPAESISSDVYSDKEPALVKNKIFFICAAVFFGIIFFQLIPLPKGMLGIISPRTADIYSSALSGIAPWSAHAISVYPYHTVFETMKLLAYAAVFFVIISETGSRQQVSRIITAIFIVGFLISVFGIIQKYGSPHKIYWFRMLSHGGEPFGPFVNRDHFGGYINLIIPLGLGMLLTDIETSKKYLIGFMSIIMITALVLSLSRGAVLSFLASLVFFSFLVFMLTEVRKGKVIFPIIGILLAVLIFLFWLDWGLVIHRLRTIVNSEHGILRPRLPIWIDSLKIIKDFPVFGVGFGNFENIFPLYQHSYLYEFWHNVHNDYLQSVIEMGPLSGFPVLIFFGFLIYRIAKVLRERNNNWKTGMAIGCATACMTILLHSAFDFNLRTASNAFLFCVVTGLSISIISPMPVESEFLKNRIWKKIILTAAAAAYAVFVIKIFAGDSYFNKTHASGLSEDSRIEYLQKAVSWDSGNSGYHYVLALSFEDKASLPGTTPYNRYKLLFESKKELETAIRQSPSKTEYLASYGWLMRNLGDNRRADEYFEKALTFSPDMRRINSLYNAYQKSNR